ncbi:MAG TPA: NAD(P)H-hydrate dehydratase [Spongiibacteraceae bacterium]|nr:NAD(P)H-hydrate dehydratase [Spongiibacteraceae bacterium]
MHNVALPQALYTAEAVRELDRLAIEALGVPGAVLMQRAGRALFAALLARWPSPSRITVYCGTGNNGGDGYVVAQLAADHGLRVQVVQLGDADRIGGDARLARESALAAGVDVRAFAGHPPPVDGVVVDALLGTGARGEPRGEYGEAIALINASGLPVVAADIPSGLCSDTGRVLGQAVRAALTVTFVGLKQGLVTAQGPAVCGELVFANLGLPESLGAEVAATALRLDGDALRRRWLPPRPATSHKGHWGHVLVVGGERGMAGAAVLAATAAARVGTGLVSCATRPEHVPALVARVPEVMAHGVDHGNGLAPLLARASVVVVGPGLGREPWAQQLLLQALKSGLPAVVDADALNLLSERPRWLGAPPANWIITPHPGEAARLLGCSTAAIEADRYGAARQLAQRWGARVALKGAGTVVATEDGLFVGDYGNPGMASGGMGDVLSGVLGGLLAQGLSPATAVCLGVCLHGWAADRAARAGGQRGLLAEDLMSELRSLVNP